MPVFMIRSLIMGTGIMSLLLLIPEGREAKRMAKKDMVFIVWEWRVGGGGDAKEGGADEAEGHVGREETRPDDKTRQERGGLALK